MIKISCKITEHTCSDNCELNRNSDADGFIEVSSLDELVKAKETHQFSFILNNGNDEYTLLQPMKWQLKGFKIR